MDYKEIEKKVKKQNGNSEITIEDLYRYCSEEERIEYRLAMQKVGVEIKREKPCKIKYIKDINDIKEIQKEYEIIDIDKVTEKNFYAQFARIVKKENVEAYMQGEDVDYEIIGYEDTIENELLKKCRR